jgi:hypothetical protein
MALLPPSYECKPNSHIVCTEPHDLTRAQLVSRVIYRRRGVRILVSQSGFIGNFSIQALLVALTVSLGLLKVATFVVDFCATRVMRMRAIYGQYVTRTSVSLSEVRQADDQGVYAMFAKDPHLVDPVPPVLRQALDGRRRRAAERAALLTRLDGSEELALGGSGSSSVDSEGALVELATPASPSGPKRRLAGAPSVRVSKTATTPGAAPNPACGRHCLQGAVHSVRHLPHRVVIVDLGVVERARALEHA